ncbi:MAG TPA: hypothetical protein ENK33_10130 [Desulfobacterales bacterium]|nr:hypothetical protein [Desulfobacterales bacterium]
MNQDINPPPIIRSKPITDDALLKVTKEVVVKFIEAGRLSPDNFSKTFQNVFTSIKDTVRPPRS